MREGTDGNAGRNHKENRENKQHESVDVVKLKGIQALVRHAILGIKLWIESETLGTRKRDETL